MKDQCQINDGEINPLKKPSVAKPAIIMVNGAKKEPEAENGSYKQEQMKARIIR